MTADPDDGSSWLLFRLLFRLAGRLPDEPVAVMRAHLADGYPDEAADLLASTVHTIRAPLLRDEAEALRAVLGRLAPGTEPPEASPGTATVPPPLVVDHLPLPGWVFHRPTDPVDAADLVTASDPGSPVGVPEDGAPSPGGGARAIWCALRGDASGPARVWLVETVPAADVVELTGEVQDRLARTGEVPRVEVFTTGAPLTHYHTAALAGSARVWVRPGTAPPRVARDPRPGDGSRPAGRGGDHRLTASERARALSYLRAADVLLAAPVAVASSAAPGTPVPLVVRCDGAWVWTDALTHRLDRHGELPEDELLDHLLAAAGPPPPLGRLDAELAMTALTTPAD